MKFKTLHYREKSYNPDFSKIAHRKVSNFFKLSLLLFISCLHLTVQAAPPGVIKGRILNPEGAPIEGASVFVAGTKIGSVTDADGRFTINVPDNQKVVLQLSSVGFATRTFNPGNNNNVTITLEKSVAGLDEVVVVGYGTQRKTTWSDQLPR